VDRADFQHDRTAEQSTFVTGESFRSITSTIAFKILMDENKSGVSKWILYPIRFSSTEGADYDAILQGLSEQL
jgi:hypothetical protein